MEVHRLESNGDLEKSKNAKEHLLYLFSRLPMTRMYDDKYSFETMRELEYLLHSSFERTNRVGAPRQSVVNEGDKKKIQKSLEKDL
jgi:hypothetical protein